MSCFVWIEIERTEMYSQMYSHDMHACIAGTRSGRKKNKKIFIYMHAMAHEQYMYKQYMHEQYMREQVKQKVDSFIHMHAMHVREICKLKYRVADGFVHK